eukprot:2384709-Amphidinium_carterae.1
MFWSKARGQSMRPRGSRRSDRWTGPAVVLGAAHRRGGDLEADGGQDLGTRRNYWVSFGTGLFLIAADQMRPVTMEESLAQEVFAEANARFQQEVQSLAAVPYEDLTGAGQSGTVDPAELREGIEIAEGPPSGE